MPGAVQPRDFALLLQGLQLLRSQDQCEAFAAALKEASYPGRSPFAWDKIGLFYTVALLEPVCAGRTTSKLVDDYQDILSHSASIPELRRPQRKWSGDVWEFVIWAEKNLPGFDGHEPDIGFLPKVKLQMRGDR